MAMTLRIPEELDAQLERLAATRHTSKHALILEATDQFLRSKSKTDRILDAVDQISEDYADALKRLEDA